MGKANYSLSLEELVLCLHLLGHTEAGAALMQTIVGELPEKELETRLLVAGHSLMARDWLELIVDEQGARHQLTAELAEVVEILAKADFSIGLQQFDQGQEKKLVFHVKADKFVEHDSSLGVVQKVFVHDRYQSMVEQAVAAFQLQGYAETSLPETGLPSDFLDNLAAFRTMEAERIQTMLEVSGVPAALAQLLAEDLQRPRRVINVMRIDYDEQQGPVSDAGFFMLAGNTRLWIVLQEGTDAEMKLRICSGSTTAFAAELKKLLGIDRTPEIRPV
ncbi:hypothetical protein [Brevibacillus fulvus]|uniref:Uncharacterized protein n=1 Tax=Brevibacillus fulvus TaxID=1125967 RepID=A0A938Y246_9BACL|nr:hypothetical protein [Brevibacillus fulvus]MBM7589795.1 hypothetical protein [Brevibacillus fulvus]